MRAVIAGLVVLLCVGLAACSSSGTIYGASGSGVNIAHGIRPFHASASPATPIRRSTQGAVSTSCQTGYITLDENDYAWTFTGTNTNPNGYQITFTNNGSSIAAVTTVGMAFYDSSGQESGSDTIILNSTEDVVPGHSLTVTVYDENGGPTDWVVDNNMPQADVASCQVATWQSTYPRL